MAKKALIILAEGFEDLEAVGSIDIMRRGGISVTVAGLSALQVRGSRGTTVIADKLLSDIKEEFDALVLPGGMPGASNLAASLAVSALIKGMFQEGKLIAAICASPAVVLAPTGILRGRRATGYDGKSEKIAGVDFSDDPLVVEGNIITSRGPGTVFVFALAIVEKLCGKSTAVEVAKAALIK